MEDLASIRLKLSKKESLLDPDIQKMRDMSFWIPLLADNMDEAIKEKKFTDHGAKAVTAHKFLRESLSKALKT